MAPRVIPGRDENPGTMTGRASGAVKPFGASEELGDKAEQQRLSPHDLHATMPHLPGIPDQGGGLRGDLGTSIPACGNRSSSVKTAERLARAAAPDERVGE